MRALAENGCSILWCGEAGVRCYAQGTGETRKAKHILRQARWHADPARHRQVVVKMYRMRFRERLPPNLSLEQIRGMEGVRVREAYRQAAERYGVVWHGRSYNRQDWRSGDTINRALSAANSCLYGICHAAIVSAGYSTALGFVHTGKQLSFVYDVADLYKTEVSVPVAFRITAEGPTKLEQEVRHACRDIFYEVRLLARIMDDLASLFVTDIEESTDDDGQTADVDADGAAPGELWDPDNDHVAGGQNYGGDDSGKCADESARRTDKVADRTKGGSLRGEGERDGS